MSPWLSLKGAIATDRGPVQTKSEVTCRSSNFHTGWTTNPGPEGGFSEFKGIGPSNPRLDLYMGSGWYFLERIGGG